MSGWRWVLNCFSVDRNHLNTLTHMTLFSIFWIWTSEPPALWLTAIGWLIVQVHSHRGRVSLHYIWGSAEQTGGSGVWRGRPSAQITRCSAALWHQPRTSCFVIAMIIDNNNNSCHFEFQSSFLTLQTAVNILHDPQTQLIFYIFFAFSLRTSNPPRGHSRGWTTLKPSSGSESTTSRKTTAPTTSLERWRLNTAHTSLSKRVITLHFFQ